MSKLRRDKIKYGSYFLVDEDGTVIARADKTGTRRDNYPWDWYLWADMQFTDDARKPFGHCESLKACIDEVEGRLNQYGVEQKP